MKKRRFSIVFVVVIYCGLFLLTGALVWNRMTDYSVALEANWGIELPSGARYTEVYETASEASFQGDGVRYHVFVYEHEGYMAELLAEENLLPADSSTPADVLLDELSVPEEERPAYDACVSRYMKQSDNDTIYLFLDKQRNKLYIVESFM